MYLFCKCCHENMYCVRVIVKLRAIQRREAGNEAKIWACGKEELLKMEKTLGSFFAFIFFFASVQGL